MAAHPRAALALLLLLAAAVVGQGADIDAPIAERRIFSPRVFPKARPPLWDFRGFTTEGTTWSCTYVAGGALQVAVDHAPIANVTTDMLSWLFQSGLRQSTVINGTKYSNFLLMHPRDHLAHWIDEAGAAAAAAAPQRSKGRRGRRAPAAPAAAAAAVPSLHTGSKATWVEMPLTGCTESKNAKAPYACPSGLTTPNPGVLSSTPESAWRSKEQVNSTVRVASFTPPNPAVLADPVAQAKRGSKPGLIEFWLEGCRTNEAGARQCYPRIITTRHTWTTRGAPPGQVKVVSRQLIGVARNVPRAVQANKERIIKSWANGQDPIKKCQRTVLHFIEEYGALQHWLPTAFEQRNGQHAA